MADKPNYPPPSPGVPADKPSYPPPTPLDRNMARLRPIVKRDSEVFLGSVRTIEPSLDDIEKNERKMDDQLNKDDTVIIEEDDAVEEEDFFSERVRNKQTESFKYESIRDSTSSFNAEEEPAKNEYSSDRYNGMSINSLVYQDFDTIDWIRDSISDRIRRAQVDAKAKGAGARILDKIYKQFYRIQAWLYVVLMAISLGFIAGTIDIVVDFIADTRFGYCDHGVFLSKKLCCQLSVEDDCQQWVTWHQAFGIPGNDWGTLVDYLVYILGAMLFAGLAAWFVKTLARWAAGSGIPEVKTILGGFVISQFSSWQTLLIKVPGLALSVSSGLNLGKEGPLVHVAFCVCELWSHVFPKYKHNQAKFREMLSAAAAAGVSVAFGAPIGGVLFSLEEVSYYFPHKTMWRAFFGAMIAALTLQVMNPFHDGKLVIFQVNYTHSWNNFEIIPFLFIGLMGGVMGSIFIRLNLVVCKLRMNTFISKYPISEVLVISAVTAIMSYWNDYLRANSSEVISQLFNQCTQASSDPLCTIGTAPTEIVILLFTTVIRLLLTVFTFGLKLPAGLFIPSLAIGASFGHATGLLMAYWQNHTPDWFFFNECRGLAYCIDPGVYGLIGAAAMLGGVTRMTVSLVVIVFEITGDVNYIVPIMFTVMVAKWSGDFLSHDGIYDEHILLREYPFLDNKASYKFSATCKDVMKSDLVVLEYRPYSVQDLRGLLKQSIYTGWPIVDRKSEMHVVGYIARLELKTALDIAEDNPDVNDQTMCYFSANTANTKEVFVDLKPWMDSTPTQVTPRTPLTIVFDMFKKLGLRYILVSYRGKLKGIVTKKDMLQYIAINYHGKFRTFVVPEEKEE